jgi:hypothetical protein
LLCDEPRKRNLVMAVTSRVIKYFDERCPFARSGCAYAERWNLSSVSGIVEYRSGCELRAHADSHPVPDFYQVGLCDARRGAVEAGLLPCPYCGRFVRVHASGAPGTLGPRRVEKGLLIIELQRHRLAGQRTNCPGKQLRTREMLILASQVSHDAGVLSSDLAGTYAKWEAQCVAAEIADHIRLGEPVTAVTELADRVEVTTGTGQRYSARRVILAAPLNTMGDIAFTPGLPPALARLVSEGHTTFSKLVF